MDFAVFIALTIMSLFLGLVGLFVRQRMSAMFAIFGGILAVFTFIQLGQDGGIAVAYQSNGTPVFVNDFFALTLIPAFTAVLNLVIGIWRIIR